MVGVSSSGKKNMNIIRPFTALFLAASCVTVCLQQVCKAVPTLNEVQSLTTTGNVSGAVYSSQYDLLFLRDTTSAVRVLKR